MILTNWPLIMSHAYQNNCVCRSYSRVWFLSYRFVWNNSRVGKFRRYSTMEPQVLYGGKSVCNIVDGRFSGLSVMWGSPLYQLPSLIPSIISCKSCFPLSRVKVSAMGVQFISVIQEDWLVQRPDICQTKVRYLECPL